MATFYKISERPDAITEAFLLQAICFCDYFDTSVEELLQGDNCTHILLAQTLTTAETRYRIAVQALRFLTDVSIADDNQPVKTRLTQVRSITQFIKAAIIRDSDADYQWICWGYEQIAANQPALAMQLRLCRFSDNAATPLDHSWWAAMVLSPNELGLEINESTIRREPPAEPPPPLTLFGSQLSALKKLNYFWRLKQTAPTVAGIHTRPIPLLVGATGVGKTALVRHFCQTNKLPLLELNSSGWLVNGSHAKITTLLAIAKFIRLHDNGVLFIDELDKFAAENSDWMRSVQQEVMALLDNRVNELWSWTAQDQQKCGGSFMLVGAGTWQSLYQDSQRQLGFDNGSQAEDVGTIDLRDQHSIPLEILNRFNANAIFLFPPAESEIRERVLKIHKVLQLPAPNVGNLDSLVRSATTSGQNSRWLESYLATVYEDHLTVRETKRAKLPATDW